MSTAMNTVLPRFGFDENCWAVVVVGRVISQDELERARLTQRRIAELSQTIAKWASDTGLPLAYVHMGTTVNWYEERNDLIPKEGADAIIGLVLAHTAESGNPVRVDKASLRPELAKDIPAGLWEALTRDFGLSPSREGLFLAPGGWAVAELYSADALWNANTKCFDAKPCAQSCSEDFPPGIELDLAQLPAELMLRAHYA